MSDKDCTQEVIDLSTDNFVNGIFVQNFEDSEKIENSLMNEVYRQTLKRIGKIVDKANDSHPNIGYISSEYGCNNIIPLLGGRGTGKTSTMVSIANFLTNRDWKELRNQMMDRKGNNSKNEVTFTCIDIIQADLMEQGESIFETVLISMYNRYEKRCNEISTSRDRNDDYLQRELGIKFSNILKSFNARRNLRSERNAIQTLHDASLRVNLSKDFYELSRDFLKFLSVDKRSRNFLVICVDDLDMNIDNAYDLMEEIHQYFMFDNMIVLVTVDITQFSHICENHFAKLCPMNSTIIEEGKSSGKQHYWKNYVSKITQNYVDKILPAENRICLPGIHNENRRPLLKNYRSERSENLEKEEEKEEEIKKVILYKIFRRTGIICDGIGKKKHYYEPDTLRKVVSLAEYLNQMEIIFDEKNFEEDSIKEDSDEKGSSEKDEGINLSLENLKENKLSDVEKNLKCNIESIYKDIVERMEYEKLQPEQRIYFDEIRRQHSSRQSTAAYGFLIRTLEEKILEESKQMLSETLSWKMKNYSYGNYIHMLYLYSSNYEKNMIHMFLALQTTSLTNIYNQILLARKENKSQKADQKEKAEMRENLLQENFRQIIGKSITGDWARVMLEHELLEAGEVEENAGEIENEFSLYNSSFEKRLNKRKISCEIKLPKKNKPQIIQAIIETVSILIPYNQIISVEESVEEEENYLKIEAENIPYIDLFGFVMRYFDQKKHIDRLEKRITTKKIKRSSYTDPYQKCALPIYSLDVYYNLLKRLYENKEIYFESEEFEGFFDGEKAKAKVPDEKQVKDIISDGEKHCFTDEYYDKVRKYAEAYRTLLIKVSYLLKRQDEYYTFSGKKLLRLQKDFEECPFIEKLLEQSRNKNVSRYMWAVIGTILFQFYCGETETIKDNEQQPLKEGNTGNQDSVEIS